MLTKDFKEEKINSKSVYKGKILSLNADNVRLPNEKEALREVVIHNGGVTIIAKPDPSKIIMVRQFRYAIGKSLWEVPAGRLQTGEVPLHAAKRELKEETGYIANNWEPLGIVYPAPGYSAEVLYFFKASDLRDDAQELDPDENVEVKVFDLKHAWQMVKDGEIRDGKTIAAMSLVMF